MFIYLWSKEIVIAKWIYGSAYTNGREERERERERVRGIQIGQEKVEKGKGYWKQTYRYW